MMRQLKGLWYFYTVDARYPLTIFWSILLGTLIVSIGLHYIILQVGEGKMGFFLPIAIYIFCAIYGFQFAKKGIPFSIKLGATRKNIFVSLGVFFLGLSIFQAVVVNTVQSIAVMVGEVLGINDEALQFIHPAQLLSDNWLTRVVIDAAVAFFLLSFLYVLGLLFYRYGLLGGGIVLGVLVVTIIFGVTQDFIIDFFSYIIESFSMILFYDILFVGIVLYGLSWLLVRKITVNMAR